MYLIFILHNIDILPLCRRLKVIDFDKYGGKLSFSKCWGSNPYLQMFQYLYVEVYEALICES